MALMDQSLPPRQKRWDSSRFKANMGSLMFLLGEPNLLEETYAYSQETDASR